MAAATTPGPCVVLVVDDDPDLREMLCHVIMSESGCMALAAEHGRHALEILATLTTPPGLILLDYMMPIMNGRELVEALAVHETYGQIPVVMITAAPESAPTTRGGLLRKPFMIEAVLTLVEAHCGNCAPREQPAGKSGSRGALGDEKRR